MRNKKNITRTLATFFILSLGIQGCAGNKTSTPTDHVEVGGEAESGGRPEGNRDQEKATLPSSDPCKNGVLDGPETDVDCGGGTCPACAPFKKCQQDSDCQSSGTVGSKNYTQIRCDDSVNSFDPTKPVDLKVKQCVNEQLVWDAIAAAVAMGSSGGGAGGSSGTGGSTVVTPTDPCSNGTLDSGETDIDCGGATCGPCALLKQCNQTSDCQTSASLNGKTYSDISCLSFQAGQGGYCNSPTLLGEIAAALPKRFTPEGCDSYQYLFVSDREGADNVYAVPCNDDPINFPTVKLTNNTDPYFHYDSISIRPIIISTLYGTRRGPNGEDKVIQTGSIIPPPTGVLSDLNVAGGVDRMDPIWRPAGEGLAYVQMDSAGKYVMVLNAFNNLNNPVTLQSEINNNAEIKGLDISAAANTPGYNKIVFSQLASDGKFYLHVWHTGQVPAIKSVSYAGGIPDSWPLEGHDPAISPNGDKLAYVKGNYVYVCPFDFNSITDPGGGSASIYACNGQPMGGSATTVASSPCWSANGRYLFYQLGDSVANLNARIIRKDTQSPQTEVTLDEFPQSGNGLSWNGERNPGCYSMMN